jgi:hypothetical protein
VAILADLGATGVFAGCAALLVALGLGTRR